jgi:uncharacterized membrane protein
MSTQTVPTHEVSTPTFTESKRGCVLRFAEFIICILWLAGSLRYMNQGGNHALLVLILSSCLIFPRLVNLTLLGLRPAHPYHLAIWIFLLAAFLPEHLASSASLVEPHLLPIFLAAICFVAQRADADYSKTIQSSASRFHPAHALILFTAIYFVVGCILAISKLHAFGYVGQDIGYFMQCLYTGLHGKLFESNQYHDLLYTREVHSDFASHNQPVLFVLLPIYWIYPHAETLFIVRNLILALSAYPAYQLARHFNLQELPAAVLTGAFLIAPAVLYQNIYDYAPLSLVGLPLLFTLLFYYQESYLPYLSSLLLCLFVREDLVFVAIGMGLIALTAKRRLIWSMTPIAIGVCWSLATWIVLLPHFQQGATSAVTGCFSYLGSSPLSIMRTIALHPQLFLTHKAGVYLAQIFTPLGVVLPFWSPAAFIALPYLFINVLGDPGCNAAIVFRHYSLIPSILLLPGALCAVQWLSKRNQFRSISTGMIAFTLLLASVGTTVLSIGGTELNWWHRFNWQHEAVLVANSMPASASVAVPRYMLPLTANRDHLYQALRLLDYHHPEVDYLVIDRDQQRMGVTDEWQPHYDDLLRQLNERNNFKIVYASQNYQIYKRIGVQLASLRPEVQ